MLRLCNRTQRYILSSRRRRCLLSSKSLSSSSSSAHQPENSVQYTDDVKNPQQVPPPPPSILLRPKSLSPLPSSLSRTSLIALSATLASAVIAAYALISANTDAESKQRSSHIYADVELAIDRSSESFKRIINQMKQTGVAAAVLWKSLRSVLSSANHEVRAGFEFRVAAFLADIAAANSSRRAAVVGAGGGAVVDWLLETVTVAGDNCGTQAEAARALAYLIADPSVSEAVFERPHAVPHLLRFIFSSQPQRSIKQPRRSSFDVSDSLKGRSMLVAALMEIITSNCDSLDNVSFKPSLPGNAETRDIAATIQVIEEGGMHLDEPHGSEDNDGGKGIKGIGIKILEGTTVLGLSRTNGLSESELSSASHSGASSYTPKNLLSNKTYDSSLVQENVTSAVVPGLWDDLLCQHVAVPFAAWALANWAMASDVNRSHIQELDHDGHAVMTALMAPERSVKWHGSLVARLLLEDHNLPLNDSVPDWSFSLLSTVSQASKTEDIPLAQVALSAFLVSIERSTTAQKIVVEKGLHLMRETSKQTIKHKLVQEALAKALELLTSEDMHLSLEESQKWAGILLHWIFGNFSSDTIQSSATKILSRIFEEYGPSSIPISQGWLVLLLADILASSKTKSMKGSTQPKTDKVKTQIDQSNIHSAQQVTNQLADAVVNLAVSQLGTATESADTLPLADLLNLEPFTRLFKKLKKDSMPKFDAADSALATLRGIKALTELCAEDSVHQNKITDYGILCLLRRLMLRDDYEQLAATEAYDASRAQELQDRVSNVSGEPSAKDTNDPASVRVPPAAHIRRHAARLLTILSALPRVQKVIAADEGWCQWLEECAIGKIPGCNDVKIRSYSRATLLNTFCNDQFNRNTSNENVPDNSFQKQNRKCPRYADIIFLINPELPHWKCPEEGLDTVGGMETKKPNSVNQSWPDGNDSVEGKGSLSTPIDEPQSCSRSNEPSLDVVFVHGIRGGPFKSWRLAEDKSSTKSGLVEKIDEEAGKLGTFWPGEWLSADLPDARLFTLKYKTNVTQWSGASLPLQEVGSVLLEKLVAAGIGNRPVVFVSHSLGGLVVKQMLYQAKAANMDDLVNNTIGVVFYSVPHFGSKLADMPWTMGLVLRPAPTIGELRSGSPRLVELNDFIRHLHKKGVLEVLSFCETKVTPIVEGYGGWALRMEIVAIESAYPGFGELVVLESTDHVNSCKPLCRDDPSYKEVLDFLKTLKARYQPRHVLDTDHAIDDCK